MTERQIDILSNITAGIVVFLPLAALCFLVGHFFPKIGVACAGAFFGGFTAHFIKEAIEKMKK